MQTIGLCYFAFGGWAVTNQWGKNSIQIEAVAQTISYSFDNWFHWITCFIYLKAAYVLPYLFDVNLYTDNEDVANQYRLTNLRLKYLNWLNTGIVMLGFFGAIL